MSKFELSIMPITVNSAVRGTLQRKGKWKCVKWAKMNERSILKPDIVRDFKFRSKCMFGADPRKEYIERACAFPDFIFRPQMHQKRLAAGLRHDPL